MEPSGEVLELSPLHFIACETIASLFLYVREQCGQMKLCVLFVVFEDRVVLLHLRACFALLVRLLNSTPQ